MKMVKVIFPKQECGWLELSPSCNVWDISVIDLLESFAEWAADLGRFGVVDRGLGNQKNRSPLCPRPLRTKEKVL